MDNISVIWKFLKNNGLTDAGVAGLMGNLQAESGLNPKNLENTYNNKLGLSDEEYTEQVDKGQYNNFVKDSAGYGLAQWTYYTRKQQLLEFCKNKNSSIGDLYSQLEFLLLELKENYTNSVYNILTTTNEVKVASNAVLLYYEAPYQAENQIESRYILSQNFYNIFNKGEENYMSIKTYQENNRVQLTKNFNSYEFRCGLGSPCACSTILIDDKLVEFLQKIRDHFNAPLTITSAYRCPSYNSRKGGATGSYHTKGQAADIVVQGHSPREVAQYAESIGILGIGLYETSKDGYFVHIDTRTYKSFWYGQSQQPRSTFGGSSNSSSGTNSSSNSLYFIGSRGEAVKEIQEMLIKLGYSCGNGEADGIFGLDTKKAVQNFQKDNGLDVDGIVGQATLSKLKELSNKNTDYKAGDVVEITATILNVRSIASINGVVVGGLSKGTEVTLTQISNSWGKITSPNGWISLEYVKKN